MQVSYSPEQKIFLVDNVPIPPGVTVITLVSGWPNYFSKTITKDMSQTQINYIIDEAIKINKTQIIEMYFQYSLHTGTMVKYTPTKTLKINPSSSGAAKLGRFRSIELQPSVEIVKKKVRKVRKATSKKKGKSARRNK